MKTQLEEPPRDRLGRVRRLTPKALRFCDLVASGHSQAGAFRIAYKHPKMSAEDAAERGWRVTQQAGVKERIEELRKQSTGKVLLTLNDRLEILARDAQTGGNTAAEKNARARAIEVYSKISGDQAPERHELTGPNGEPMAVAGTLLVGRLSRREKLEAIKARRAEAKT